MYSYSDRDTRTKTATQYLFPDSTSFFNEGSRSRDKGHNLRADFRMQWKIDGNNTLDFRPRFSFSSRRSESMDVVPACRRRTAFVRKQSGKPACKQRHKLPGQRRTDFQPHSFAAGTLHSPSSSTTVSPTRANTPRRSPNSYIACRRMMTKTLYRFMDSKQWNNTFGGRLTWTEPLGDVSKGNFLTVAYKMNYKANNADKLTYDLASDEFGLPQFPTKAPEGAEADPNLSNRFRNSFFSQEMQVGYKKVGKDFNLEAGMVFAPSQSSSKDLISSERDIPARRVWNIAPTPVCAGGSQRPAAFRQTTVRVPRRHPERTPACGRRQQPAPHHGRQP